MSESETPTLAADDPELRALQEEWRALEQNIILSRMGFARAAGLTHNGKRDTWGVFGYPEIITVEDYRAKYRRGGIAGRIVDAFPNACWRGEMELVEDETKDDYTPFEQAWHDFDQRLQVRERLQRVDRLSGLSTYAILLIGEKGGKLEEPLPKVTYSDKTNKNIIFLTAFVGSGGPPSSLKNRVNESIEASSADATIEKYDLNLTSARFGKPESYLLSRVDPTGMRKSVHWSRVQHVAEGCLEDDVFGMPALERVWNLLIDLDKVTGGGSEAFWLRANQGLHLNVDKDMDLAKTKDTLAALKEQVEAYKHNLDRFIRTRGVDVDVLGSDVANFMNPADAILTQISGAKSIPKRILTGSEMGELASSQDRDNWSDQVNGRQTGYLGPNLVRPFVDHLIEYGYLPSPQKSPSAYEVVWPHQQKLTEAEKADGAAKWADVNSTMGEPVFTEAEIRDKWYGMPPLSDKQRKEINDRKEEDLKRQQDAMAAAKPAEPEPRAAEDEQIRQLEEALLSGDLERVSEILALGDYPGHPFHGNQHVGGTSSETEGSITRVGDSIGGDRKSVV